MEVKIESNKEYWQYGKVSDQEETSPSKELNADGILDLLNEEDSEESEKKEPEKEGKERDIKEPEKEEEKELELKDEELEEVPEDEDIDIIVPVNKKVIEKDFPGLFKKYPQLEAAYYKSQQYAEVFPSVNDAREAAEKASNLDKFEEDILSGNLDILFRTIKQNAPKSLNKIADNLIQTIGKVDESVALHITGNILKTILSKSERDGIRNKNEDLQAAAKIINAHIFGDDEINPPTRLEVDKVDPREEELNRKEQEFAQKEFDSALNSLQTRVDNVLKATIDANIDPKDVMSSYVKKNAIKDASEQVEKLIGQDKAFQNVLNNLWRSAKDAKYSSSSLERIRSAYLSKAKTVLRDAIRTARNEALKESGKSGNSSDKDKRGTLPAHRVSSNSNNKGSVKEIPKGMSTKDFIMAD